MLDYTYTVAVCRNCDYTTYVSEEGYCSRACAIDDYKCSTPTRYVDRSKGGYDEDAWARADRFDWNEGPR